MAGWIALLSGCLQRDRAADTHEAGTSLTRSSTRADEFPNYLAPDCEDEAQLPPVTGHHVGTVGGSAGVSEGAAVYSVPIVVPPGRREIGPSLKLQYSSQFGSGQAGMGWSLSGVSGIRRCPRTVAQDGDARSIDWSEQDRLCLDGVRLVLVQGQYGHSGSEYRTETNTFARIRLIGDMASSDSGFQLESKSGAVSYYGGIRLRSGSTDTNAVHVPEGASVPLAWALKRAEDRQGNSIIYDYDVRSGEFVLVGADYTGLGEERGDRHVRIEYEPRPDRRTSFLAGAAFISSQRIRALESLVRDEVVRRYELSYALSRATARSLLVQILTCATSPCIPESQLAPTTFTYQDEEPGFVDEFVRGSSETTELIPSADFDGDGRRDFMAIERPAAWGGAPIGETLRLSSGGVLDLRASPWDRRFERPLEHWFTKENGDFDSDGRVDLRGIRDGRFAIVGMSGERVSDLRVDQLRPFWGSESADFDGNGLSDVLLYERDGLRVHLQCAPLSDGTLRFCDSVAFAEPGPDLVLESVSDIDGDGRADLFFDWNGATPPPPHQRSPQLEPMVLFARVASGRLTFEPRNLSQLGLPGLSPRDEPGRGFADLNGDALPDFYAFVEPTRSLSVWLNQGTSFMDAQNLGPVDLQRRHRGQVLSMDWDADGVTELLVPGEVLVGWCVFPYRSEREPTCSEPGNDRAFELPGAPVNSDGTIYRWDALELSGDALGRLQMLRRPTSISAPPRGATVDDFTGDGLADVGYRAHLLYVKPEGRHRPVVTGRYQDVVELGNRVSRNTGRAPDLLMRVEDGRGFAAWTYGPLSGRGAAECPERSRKPFYRADFDALSVEKAFPFTSTMHVVARFNQDDGIGGESPRCYRYEDARWSTEGRGFLGFRKIVEEEALVSADDPARLDPKNLRKTTLYRQEFPYAGAVENEAVHLASDPPEALPFSENRSLWDAECSPAFAGSVCFTRLTEAASIQRDLRTRAWVSSSTTTYVYEGADRLHGNVSEETTRVEDATMRHALKTVNVYDYADATSWWLDKLVEKSVVTEAVVYRNPEPKTVLAANRTHRLRTKTIYHPDAGGARARLPKRQLVQEGVANEEVVFDFEDYDVYGNLTRKTVKGHGLLGLRTTELRYDPNGYFLESTTNAAGHVGSQTVDPETGLVTSSTDPNGLRSLTTYDEFGLVTGVIPPARPPIVIRRQLCALTQGCPARAHSVEVTQSVGAPSSFEYRDVRDRLVKKRVEGFLPGGDVVTVVEYDARGRVLRQSEPSFAADGAYFTSWRGHDALGRPSEKIVDKSGYLDFDGAPDETYRTEYRYSGLTTSIVVEGKLELSRTQNTKGQLVQVVDAQGHPVRHFYDGLGNEIAVEDHLGHQIRAEYNTRGHLTASHHPDRGTWSFIHNALGEQISTIDANGTHVKLVRDVLGRIRERHINGALDATWVYDQQKLGLLDREVQYRGPLEAFTRAFEYDDRSRVTHSTEEFDGQTFQTRFAYNCLGALRGLEFPNGEAVQYRYDERGYRTAEVNPRASPRAPPYRELLAVTPRGQTRVERFGNQLYGVYEYFESTGQIRRICTGTTETCQNPVQELEYDYRDPFGNVTSQTRRALDEGGAPQEVSERFEYDTLQRLTAAHRKWSDDGRAEHVSYGHDALGNVTLKSDYAARYEYGDATRQRSGGGPHAVVALETNDRGRVADFFYDANGNMRSGNGRRMAYSALGKLQSVHEAGATTLFAYDPNGARYRQETTGAITRSVGRAYEEVLTPRGIVENAFVGPSIIVRRTGSAREVFFVHRDRLGSVETVTNASGEVVERHGYDVYGLPRDSWWDSSGGRLHSGEFSSALTIRGFTDHDHLDGHKLIHMNGRVFDPALARFLSADPFIQDDRLSEGLNPYSYLLNNPLSGVDPSGYRAEDVEVIYVGASRIHPDAKPVGPWFRADIIIATHRPSGQSFTQFVDPGSRSVVYRMNGRTVAPDEIGGPLRHAADQLQSRAELRLRIAESRLAYEAGARPWEAAREAIYGWGAIMMTPLLATVGVVATEAILMRMLAQAGAAGPGAVIVLSELMNGLMDQPSYAMAGAGVGGRAISLAAEAIEDAPAGATTVAANLAGKIAGAAEEVAEGAINSAGRAYPLVRNPGTGELIPHPGSGLQRVPVAERVPWGAQERGAFIKEWYDRGLPTPEGGWARYDIHHIRPREYGGTNAFENLVPVERSVHRAEFNAWWRNY